MRTPGIIPTGIQSTADTVITVSIQVTPGALAVRDKQASLFGHAKVFGARISIGADDL